MPTVKRRNRKQRERGLSETQRMLLLHGSDFGDGERGFENAREERAAWRQHRLVLLAEWDQPGSRPLAFFRFDLAMGDRWPKHWHEELFALEKNRLLSRDEEIRVEKIRKELDPDQEPEYLDPQRAEACARNGLQGPRPYTSALFCVRLQRDEAEFVAGWHARRGRTELESKYRERARILSDVLVEAEATEAEWKSKRR